MSSPAIGIDDRACQIHCLAGMARPSGYLENLWDRRGRLKRVIRMGFRYAVRWFARQTGRAAAVPVTEQTQTGVLQVGDVVRVRSLEEIRATLDLRSRTRRCGFFDEMAAYCETEQRVLQVVNRIIDERDHGVKHCRGVILLDGLLCRGTKDYGRCDRLCYYFWREEWLEKVE